MLFKKDQTELDAAFLEAVGKYKFKKARKLVAEGANVLARDAKGNTALHLVASQNPNHGDCNTSTFSGYDKPYERDLLDEFVCFLLARKLDINAPNHSGRTCLHFAAANPHGYAPEPLNILLNRGADANAQDGQGQTPVYAAATKKQADMLLAAGTRVKVQDHKGRTPLHWAAAHGLQEHVNAYLTADPSLIDVQDNAGHYPHNSAVAGQIGYHALSRALQDVFNKRNTPPQEAGETPAPSAPAAASDDWVLLNADKKFQVAHVSAEEAIGYRLTELFNFRARIYTQIAHHLEGKSEGIVTKGFDEFPDKTLFVEACRELRRLGGEANETMVYSQSLSGKTP